jgi:DNA-binding transcriptional LysR family regulator
VNVADLQIFLAVGTAGTLSAAARQLGVAPMQISRRVLALEDELGVRLFHRTTRSVTLTAEGHALVPYATAMVEAETAARSELGRAPGQASGLLKVTAPTVLGQSIIMPLLPELLAAHPALRIEVNLSDQLVDLVGQGYDLAIRVVASLRESDLVARRLAVKHRVLCASPDYLLKRGVPRLLQDLDDHECVHLSPLDRWPFRVNDEERRVRIHGRVVTNSVEAARIAAVQGFGLVMLGYWNVRDELASGQLIEVHLEDAVTEELSVWAVMPSRRFVPERVRVFLDAAEAALRSE